MCSLGIGVDGDQGLALDDKRCTTAPCQPLEHFQFFTFLLEQGGNGALREYKSVSPGVPVTKGKNRSDHGF